jgi:hypothetical protein
LSKKPRRIREYIRYIQFTTRRRSRIFNIYIFKTTTSPNPPNSVILKSILFDSQRTNYSANPNGKRLVYPNSRIDRGNQHFKAKHYSRGLKLKLVWGPHFRDEMLRGPQFTRKKFLWAATYKKSYQNKLNLIKFYTLGILRRARGPRVWDPCIIEYKIFFDTIFSILSHCRFLKLGTFFFLRAHLG